jgi:FMN phosphatase YigB (HAD superfamily)
MTKTVFLDIDDCLIQTSQLTKGDLKAVEDTMRYLGIKKASKITFDFAKMFQTQYDKHQSKNIPASKQDKLTKFTQKMKRLQKKIITKYRQYKKWSREVFIYTSAMNLDVKLTNNQILLISKKLWEKIQNHAQFYPDSKPFLDKLKENRIPFYLITSSDCRLTLNANEGLFEYDPEYSKDLKIKRLKILTDWGIPKENIFVGDPIDKPDVWVFQQALQKAKNDNPMLEETVMIGDSVKNDLNPAKKAGMDKLIFLNRHSKKRVIKRNDGILEVNSLEEIDVDELKNRI